MADVSAIAVKQWLDKFPFGAAAKARARNMLSKLMDLAMLWEYIPVGRNPMGTCPRERQHQAAEGNRPFSLQINSRHWWKN